MFNWKVEDLFLMNDVYKIGSNKYYYCESTVYREDKINFVDSNTNGKLSYILNLIDKFNIDKHSLPKIASVFGDDEVKTVSLKAWIKRNDTKGVIDNKYNYGSFNLLGCQRYIQANKKLYYDVYADLVDEVFRRQLIKCEEQERKYFVTHDEYSILKTTLREYIDRYRTSFNVNIMTSSDGNIYIHDSDNYNVKRPITINELTILIDKYKQLDEFINNIINDIHISV